MRDSLIKSINEFEELDFFTPPDWWIEHFADHILADGWIRPPCKVGDTVYCLTTLVDYDKCENCNFYYAGGMGDHPSCEKGKCGHRAIECIEIEEVLVTQKELYWWLYMGDFGKTVFLTREEAEQALERREKE